MNARLQAWASEAAYKQFKFGYCDSPKAAFDTECRVYHDFGGSAKLDNKVHPARPTGSGWKCKYCLLFD